MRNSWRNNFIGVGVIALLMTAGCSRTDKTAEAADSYTCPMHPTVESDKPGSCPVCAMDLVKRAKSGEAVQVTEELKRLAQAPNGQVIASIKTIRAEVKTMPVSIRVQGMVTYDTRYVYNIPSRIAGHVMKVYLKYNFQPVSKGQKVVDIYSQDLLAGQRELLYVLENDPGNSALIQSAKSKLLLLGATPEQVDRTIALKETTNEFSIFSDYAGYIIKAGAQAPVSSTTTASNNPMDGMGSAPAATEAKPVSASGDLIREGDHVSAGQMLFQVVNTSALRIEMNLPVSQAGAIKVNDEATIDFGGGRIERAKIDFIQPFFTEGEEFVKLRAYLKNTQKLQIGQLVKATISLEPVERLLLPKEAVLDLGSEKIVFVKDGAVLKPRKVRTGIRLDGFLEIKDGLTTAEEVASNAQYLVDSESFIKPN